jgi:methionine-S-sulfoxide reductase
MNGQYYGFSFLRLAYIQMFKVDIGLLWQTAVGYTQGQTQNPTYEQVCSGRTGHAEAVLVEYNPSEVSYEQLLDVFWKKHDPTQKNRQVWLLSLQFCRRAFGVVDLY